MAVKVGGAGGVAWGWHGWRRCGSRQRRDRATRPSTPQPSAPSRHASEQQRACPRRQCSVPPAPAAARIDAIRVPRGSRAPRGGGAEERGAARCSLLDRLASRVLNGGGGGGGGGGGVGEARCCRRLRRRQRAADAGRWSGGRRRPRSAGAKRWCSVDRPDERAARLSRSLARPTQHRRRRQSAARGAVRARTRVPVSGGRSGGTAVRPWRWRRPVRCSWPW